MVSISEQVRLLHECGNNWEDYLKHHTITEAEHVQVVKCSPAEFMSIKSNDKTFRMAVMMDYIANGKRERKRGTHVIDGRLQWKERAIG